MEFIKPPPLDESNRDLTLSYYLDEVVEVTWTLDDDEKVVSLVLWQLDPIHRDLFGEMKYVKGTCPMLAVSFYREVKQSTYLAPIEKFVNSTGLNWRVDTEKDLTVSNLFRLDLFEDGKTSPDSKSQRFRILRDDEGKTTASSTGTTSPITTSTSTDTSTDTSTATSTVATTSAAAGTSEVLPPDEEGSLNVDAKIAIGVAVPFGLLILAVAGFLVFWRRRKSRKLQHGSTQLAPSYTDNDKPLPYSVGEQLEGVQPHQYANTEGNRAELPTSVTELPAPR